MAFKPTDAQKSAIQKSGNILVSAAAGSGKTAVLVERVAQLLINKNYSADRLLIVTFTNAAAAEMRTRIEKRLSEEIQKDPNNEHVQKQKYLLPNADICTIDSFCPSGACNNCRNCLQRALFDSGQRRLPKPPESNMICIIDQIK